MIDAAMAAPFEDLFNQFLDDRDSLTDEQYAELVAALSESPERLVELKDQLILSEKLAQVMAVDRADFPAQLAQRIRDLDRSDDDLEEQVAEVRDLVSQDLRPRRRGRRWGRWAMAATLLLACGAGAFYFTSGLNDRPQVTHVYGATTLVRNETSTRLLAGERLRNGDRLQTDRNAFAVLRYKDGTRVNVGEQTLLEIVAELKSGKTMDIDRGAVASVVAPQSSLRPMRFRTPRADAKVVGTKLLLEVSADETRLNVGSGVVELRGLDSKASIPVGRRQYAVSDGGAAEVESLIWPSSRRRLEVLLEPETQRLPPAWNLRGRVAWDRGLRFQAGSAVLPINDAQAVTEACMKSNELTIELMLRCTASRLQGPARIVTLSSDAFTRNFMIGQNSNFLVLRIRTPETGENGTNPEIRICRVEDRDLHHLVVTYRNGLTCCYLDGQRVAHADQIVGDFSNWTQHYLLLGDEWSGESSHAWRGEIQALAIYSRALNANEVMRNTASIGR